MTTPTPLEHVLSFVRAVEAGGGSAELRPFLAEDFQLTEWPHALSKTGSIRNLAETLSGADDSQDIVADQRFEVVRTTSQDDRVVLEMNWSATLLLDLPHWDRGDTIRARSTAVFQLRDGLIISQDTYDCYYTVPE
ncbi:MULTISPECIES: nuclear transport factor 2 family protein [Paenarthrobacter]|jgi:limonene-1,2-epoxide hydrolase|uniref:nuclear transport factor 2 family protein n=1 Tax=Paenarthrobacter TaxID=1742992 RepID=UPI002365D277|nr:MULTISPECIES: nuclear transport factor 2 family protein [Paenarthrobacter]MDD7833513.1 nuclear transport factor 2 family protein [Paenarthrobacter sp. AB444]MDP9934185.1 limonene-1,2-epoxide hydrolase [Paenarthrobacter nicotinovorans]